MCSCQNGLCDTPTSVWVSPLWSCVFSCQGCYPTWVPHTHFQPGGERSDQPFVVAGAKWGERRRRPTGRLLPLWGSRRKRAWLLCSRSPWFGHNNILWSSACPCPGSLISHSLQSELDIHPWSPGHQILSCILQGYTTTLWSQIHFLQEPTILPIIKICS